MADTKRIDLFLRPDSTATKQQAIDYAFKRANERDNDGSNYVDGVQQKAHYYDVTDSRTGAKYMVFGEDAQKILRLPKLLDILNKSEFLKGFTKDYIINSKDGVYTVELDNDDDYNVILTVEDNNRADAHIENEKQGSFDIALYDKDAFVEDEERLDCSENPIKVNAVIVYK